VGRGGVEGACEDLLRGSRGLFQKGIEGELLEDLPPVPGQDVHLTLDIALEADVEDLLDHPPGGASRTAGAAVVLDCRSGDVLVLATAPRYDPRTFQADFPDLARDPAGPLLNRAVQGLYPLGSVFKAITATAALHEGAITTQTTLTCNGVLDPAHPNRFRCDVFVTHGAVHGTIPLRTAIQKSCNLYFYQVAELLGRREGGGTDLALARDRLQTWAERFGLGRRAGLGLPGEQAGNLNVGDPRNLAVGQGELLVTPFQVAQVYALVASDGRMPPPRLVRERAPAEPTRPPLPVNPNWMAFLRDAFAAVVNEQGGTAYSNGYLPEVRYAGKTGTAQAGAGEPHAWFAGFAPAENPRIAFAIVVEHGGHGGTAAAPIGRELVKACLSHGYLDDQPRGNAEPANSKPTNGRNGNGNRGNIARPSPAAPPQKPAPPQPVG
jgi:cell division protein FtsI/penicillin-binding protein 2